MSPILLNHHVLQLQDLEFLTQLTLDCSRIINVEKADLGELESFELHTWECVYRLHVSCIIALKRNSDS